MLTKKPTPVTQNQMNVPPSNHRKNSPCLLGIGILINIYVHKIRYLKFKHIHIYRLTNLTITLKSSWKSGGVVFNLNFSELRKNWEKKTEMRLKRKQNKALRVEESLPGLKKSCEVEKKAGPLEEHVMYFSESPCHHVFSASAPRASSSTRRSWVKPGRWQT